MNLNLLWIFIKAIPDLIKLLEALEKIRIEHETEGKVTDDLKTLHQAFAAKDAAKVTALFSGAPPASPSH